MPYAPGLDGLRAIAVLAVVLYHLDVVGFAGGYVGVDLFFVISGFLITGIIRRRIREADFSLGDFYLRRAVRLLPALFATVVLTSVGAAFLLTNWDFQAYARSAVAALLSVSNLLFFLESGYWDTEAIYKPLLHTWSLGVEEQFYLLWPLLLVLAATVEHRLSPRYLFGALVLIGAAAMLWAAEWQPAAAFYLTPFRVFQFAGGALLSTLGRRHYRLLGRWSERLVGALGLLLVVVSVALLDSERFPYPSAWALLPTVGAMFMIAAVTALRDAQFAAFRGLLESPPAVHLGKLSYSLYLVHWPLVSLFHYRLEQPRGMELPGLLAVMWLLAICLHYGVERRFYRRPGTETKTDVVACEHERARRPIAALTVLCMGLLCAVMASAWLGDGWSWRHPRTALSADAVDAGMQRRYRHLAEACQLHSPDSPRCHGDYGHRVLVIGNSLEEDGYNFLRTAASRAGDLQFVLFGTTNRCPGLQVEGGRVRSENAACQARFDRLFEPALLQSLSAVLYAANAPFARNKAGHLAVLRELRRRRSDLPLFTLGGYINTRRRCSFYIAEYGDPASCVAAEHVRYFANQPEAAPLFGAFQALEMHYIDRVALLCNGYELTNCRSATPDGTPMMYDDVHSSLEFAEYAGLLYRRRFGDRLLRLIEAPVAGDL